MSRRAPVVLDACRRCGVSIVGMIPWSRGSRLYCDPCYDVEEPPRPAHRPQTGPEPIDRQISARVPASIVERLEARAEAEGVTKGEVVRDALEAWL